MIKGKRILVTGGAGFIGSNLVTELVKNNEVVVVDNLHSGDRKNLSGIGKKIQFYHISCDSLSLHHNVDLIYHLGMPSSSPMYKGNPHLVGKAINGTIQVFDLARQQNVDKVVFASTSSLYNGLPPPHSEDLPIAVTDYYTEARYCVERISELYNRMFGIKSVGLRFFSVYGMHEEAKGVYANIITQFLWEMNKGQPPVIYGDGNQTRDFTFVSDIVSALMLAAESKVDWDIFNVGTGTSYSFNQVVEFLNKALGTNIEPIHTDSRVKNYVESTLADLTKVKQIGYRPEFTITDGIKELIEYTNGT